MPRWNGVQYNLKDSEPPFAFARFVNKTWLFSLFEQPDSIPLYAAPVRTKDLTEYELDELRFKNLNYLDYARAVIAADREKNRA